MPGNYKPIIGSEHSHPQGHRRLGPTGGDEPVTATLILRRQYKRQLPNVNDYAPGQILNPEPPSRTQSAATFGADSQELNRLEAFARANNLTVVESDQSRRSVVVRGTAAAINKAFHIELHDYQSFRRYRSHEGAVSLPAELGETVEAVIGLDNRPVPARHHSSAQTTISGDPPATKPLTPIQVADLYQFPNGNGTGQTIGIFEMPTAAGNAGYAAQDLARTMRGFSATLRIPGPMNVSIDGFTNSGISTAETCLDISVAAAIAPGAEIAVYFTGDDVQGVIHALQTMIHPARGEPKPTVISISYGWGPDDDAASFSAQEFEQLGKLFQDAASLSITVLVSTGDTGAFIESPTLAQTSYPATEPWVMACGGSTLGNVRGKSFDQYVWNDRGAAGPRATGGGVSARFPLPDYQKNAKVPRHVNSKQTGRGIPDVAGNASENSGYIQFVNGRSQSVGGTSAVAPLYAGLIARINSNLGYSVGFVNPVLYSLAAFHNIPGPPGPVNNSFARVTGYPARAGWDACTGLGSVNGTALQNALKGARTAAAQAATLKK